MSDLFDSLLYVPCKGGKWREQCLGTATDEAAQREGANGSFEVAVNPRYALAVGGIEPTRLSLDLVKDIFILAGTEDTLADALLDGYGIVFFLGIDIRFHSRKDNFHSRELGEISP